MAEGGKSAKDVFKKTLPKLINILGKDPPFSVVTASLNAEDLITDQELGAIKTKQGVERGSEVAYTLRDKIKDSDDPNACLLAICEIFESELVDNATLKKHGESMRTSISNGTAATPVQVPAVTPSAPPHPSAAALPPPRTNPNELGINDLVTVRTVLTEAMFGPVHWTDLGLSLGLFMPTLNVISRTNGDANDYLNLALQYWLQKKDNVTGTTWHNLIRAVRSTGDNAAADRIRGILRSRNINC
ncbi:PREDICTED: uncharacterized protein LOC109584298 [Amphimedon queenslandica]|uniref:Death domain-containing protein n=1 Tax=Amphimedon queenslandica TaxID=400682 RepID=A0AAN0JFH9_AMPQE|nr:PREDICTED: uncharacterized protein LOC109584298 [Amphimedon queenslandica]XP_019855542.1 PREDICTED: uncharacterized protein LOC109584298 [Amphimedon queenslandica]|eukprot:XP_019855541.1 PREDICTED: uncharacterized protein LOC109584298 [Amphimedon queenslandica]